MTTTLASLADVFRQLAFISALIGGFAFAFLGVLLAIPSRNRIVDWTAGMAMATVAGLLICVIGWTLMASEVATATPAQAGAEGVLQVAMKWNLMHSRLSLLFIVGMLLFLASLGLSGWMRSRALGAVSTIIALLAAVGLMFVLTPFVR